MVLFQIVFLTKKYNIKDGDLNTTPVSTYSTRNVHTGVDTANLDTIFISVQSQQIGSEKDCLKSFNTIFMSIQLLEYKNIVPSITNFNTIFVSV